MNKLIKILGFYSLLLLSADAKIFSIGFINISTGEIALLFIIILPLFYGYNFIIQYLKNYKVFIIFACLFIFSMIISVFISPVSLQYLLKMFGRYVLIIIAVFQLFIIYRNENQEYNLLIIIFTIAVIQSVLSLLESKIPAVSEIFSFIFRDNTSVTFNGVIRPAGTMSHANVLTCFNVINIFIGLFLKEKKRLTEYIFWGSVILIIISISLSGSRNAYIAFILGMLIYLSQKQKRLLISKIFILLLMGYLFITPSRDDEQGLDKEKSSTRIYLWQSAINITKDYPLFGVGPGGYNIILPNYADTALIRIEAENIKRHALNAHNGFLNFIAEFGIAGIIIFFLAVIKIYSKKKNTIVLKKYFHEYAIIISFLSSFLFDAFFYSYFYMITGVTIMLLLIQKFNEEVQNKAESELLKIQAETF